MAAKPKPFVPDDHLREVFGRIRAANLTANELSYVAHAITRLMEASSDKLLSNFIYPDDRPVRYLRNRREELREFSWLLEQVQKLYVKKINEGRHPILRAAVL